MDEILNHDVGFRIMDFLVDEYIFVGSVNRRCRDIFKSKDNMVTRVSSCFESVEKLRQSGILNKTNEINLEPYVYNSPSIEVLEYAEKNKVAHDINGALAYAIRRKDFKIIDWMECTRFEMHGPSCMIAAVESGDLEMVKRYCVDNVLDYRAHNFFPNGAHLYNLNDRDRIEVCSNWRTYVGDYLLESVKNHGYFDILKWLHAQGIPDPRESCGVVGDAVLTCSEDMIKWMMDHGYVMNVSDLSGSTGITTGSYTRWLMEIGSH